MSQGLQVFEKIEAGKFVYEEDLTNFGTTCTRIRQKHIWFVGGDNREVCHKLQNGGKLFAKRSWSSEDLNHKNCSCGSVYYK